MTFKCQGESSEALSILREALVIQRNYLMGYEKPSEPLAFETLRTFDDLFCRELMEPTRSVSNDELIFRNLSTWGINHALRRIIPKSLSSALFRSFPSRDTIQEQADDFVFKCGALALAERFEGWLCEGMLRGKVEPYPETGQMSHILVLRSAMSSCYDEAIGRAGLRWASGQI